jgi:hypothetical protein
MNKTITTTVRHIITFFFVALATLISSVAITEATAHRFDWAMIPSVCLMWAMAYITPVILKRAEPN